MQPNRLQDQRFTAIVVPLLVILLAACGGGGEIASPPTATPTPIPTATPTPVPTPTPQAAPTTAAPTSDALEWVLTEEQLNQMLQEALADQPDLPVNDVAIQLEPDLIVGSGTVSMGFINAAVELSLTLAAMDGKLAPELIDVQLDGKPVPGFLQGQIDSFTTPFLEEARNADLGFYVESVDITDTELRVTGRRQ